MTHGMSRAGFSALISQGKTWCAFFRCWGTLKPAPRANTPGARAGDRGADALIMHEASARDGYGPPSADLLGYDPFSSEPLESRPRQNVESLSRPAGDVVP